MTLSFLVAPARIIVANHALIVRLARREIEGRIKSTMLGTIWLVVSPLMILTIYSVAFQTILRTQWTLPDGQPGNAVILLFIGITVFAIVGESLGRAPGLVLENIAYVKKVVFPLEILPVVSLLSSSVQVCINLVMLLLMEVILVGVPPITAVLFPIVLLPLLLITLGISWFLASIGVFVRDVKQIIAPVITGLMFLAPVFYPITAVPARLRPFIMLNPVTQAIDDARGVLYLGELPDPTNFLIALALGWACAVLGCLWFMRTRKGFADVL